MQCHPILVGRVTQLLLLDSFDKRDAPPVQIVTHKLVIVIILLIFPYLTGKVTAENIFSPSGIICQVTMSWSENVGNIGETPKIEIISRFFFHPLIKQPSVTTIKEFPMQNNLFKSFKYSRHVTEYSPKRFNYQSKMLNEPQGNCFLNEPLIDDCIPKYLIFIISISQIFSTHPELDSPGEVTALPHSHVVRLPLPDNVTRLVSLAECAELKNYIELLKEFSLALIVPATIGYNWKDVIFGVRIYIQYRR